MVKKKRVDNCRWRVTTVDKWWPKVSMHCTSVVCNTLPYKRVSTAVYRRLCSQYWWTAPPLCLVWAEWMQINTHVSHRNHSISKRFGFFCWINYFDWWLTSSNSDQPISHFVLVNNEESQVKRICEQTIFSLLTIMFWGVAMGLSPCIGMATLGW